MQGAVLPVPSKNCQHWRHFTSHLGQQEMPKSQKQIDTTFRHRCLHVPYMFFTNNISAFWNPSRFKMCWLDQHLIQSCFLSNILVHVNWKTHGGAMAQIWVINHCRFELSTSLRQKAALPDKGIHFCWKKPLKLYQKRP